MSKYSIRASLFRRGLRTLHSGSKSQFFIDCNALRDYDWKTIALLVSQRIQFGKVVGIPTGGLELAEALKPYARQGYPPLIVDDVLTTGTSMEEAKRQNPKAIGIVLFARGKCPDWVTPIFMLNALFEEI